MVGTSSSGRSWQSNAEAPIPRRSTVLSEVLAGDTIQ